MLKVGKNSLNKKMENSTCENKDKACCENKDKSCCGNCMTSHCHNWRKCHLVKRIILICFIILAFCIGSEWGEMKGEFRGSRYENRGGMMDWGGYGRFDSIKNRGNQAVGEVKVDVASPATITPVQ